MFGDLGILVFIVLGAVIGGVVGLFLAVRRKSKGNEAETQDEVSKPNQLIRILVPICIVVIAAFVIGIIPKPNTTT